jgi:hypothetical protein
LTVGYGIRVPGLVISPLVKDFDFKQKPMLLPRIPPDKLPPNLIPVLKN